MKSLKDQLLKAGLTDKKSVRNARMQKQNKKSKKERSEVPDITRQVEQAQRDKVNRDKELNRLRQLELTKKANLAQIQQLIGMSKIDRTEGEVAYHFTMNDKVKSIHVTAEQQKQLARNQIAIAIFDVDRVELVPRVVAEKIAQRDSSYIIETGTEGADVSVGDDPYADYQIPDDLVW